MCPPKVEKKEEKKKIESKKVKLNLEGREAREEKRTNY